MVQKLMRHTFSGYCSLRKTTLLASLSLLCLSPINSRGEDLTHPLLGITSVPEDAAAPSPNNPIITRPYTNSPFDMTAKKLPAAFHGNDPVATFVNIVRNLEVTKGEFETTQQFNERVGKGKTSPLVDSLTLDSLFAFQIDTSFVTTTYDADKGQMMVNLKFVQPIGGFASGDDDAIQLLSLETNKEVYSATNAFGAEFQVAKATDNTVSVFTTNRKDYHLKWDQHTPFFSYDFGLSMNVDTAKAAKSDISILAVCHLVQVKGHYVATYQHETVPTMESAFDLDMTDNYIAIKLDQIWIYNSVTGDIYQRVLPQPKK